ncbi:helix-turn-helix domain-containing protein [Enterobacteriales bacterium SAP-6]|uniref:Helix-turn-helix domain-containing protein n=2 Tax=Acerihabitans arboris TaxID=2691583 RepID=A0A845ST19_9GAMM|nr:helix-turn-helix domain-containing protein [Acerihabitans arboris]
MREHDFAFVCTSTAFTLAFDPSAEPVDSDQIIAATGLLRMSLGDDGAGKPAIVRGGRFVFDTANEALPMGMLPQVIKLNAGEPRSPGQLKALLTMNEEESRSQNLGSQFFVGRLMELILLEALRRVAIDMDPQQTGLLAGLADPKVALAVTLIHEKPSHPWSVNSLARLRGLSRSGFAHRFSSIMGIGVIEYLQQWRMALAKDALRSGASTIGEIALQVGFQSSSAFSSAFSRIVG